MLNTSFVSPDMSSLDLLTLYERLYRHFGPQRWWPVLSDGDRDSDNVKFEICVGAILTQNTAWRNVEQALQKLSRTMLLNPRTLARAPLGHLRECVREAGYFNQKARKLKIFAQHLENRGGLETFFSQPVKELRAELLLLWGIGPETADSIILYAAKKPSFVIDNYTKRLLGNFGVEFSSYAGYQKFFEERLPRRVKLWSEFHALIVAWGKFNTKNSDQAIRLIRGDGVTKERTPLARAGVR